MSRSQAPLFAVVAILCHMVTSSASWSKCPNSGKDEEDFMKFAGTLAEFDDISMSDCNEGDKCFECTLQDKGIMFYAAGCGPTLTGYDEIACSAPGRKPCDSSDDVTCHTKFTQIVNLQICRYSYSKDMVIHQGDFNVYCNDTCSSAVIIDNEDMYMGKSCTTDIQMWYNAMKLDKPTALTKLCEGTQSCSIEGWPKVESASDADAASDDPGSGGVNIANRAAILALAVISWLGRLI